MRGDCQEASQPLGERSRCAECVNIANAQFRRLKFCSEIQTIDRRCAVLIHLDEQQGMYF